jgi:hypothetical protein
MRIPLHGDDWVSRSQAKRILVQLDPSEEVFLDFSGIESIGQAFADEVFRVSGANHPNVKVLAHNANEQVNQMIGRAHAAAKSSEG